MRISTMCVRRIQVLIPGGNGLIANGSEGKKNGFAEENYIVHSHRTFVWIKSWKCCNADSVDHLHPFSDHLCLCTFWGEKKSKVCWVPKRVFWSYSQHWIVEPSILVPSPLELWESQLSMDLTGYYMFFSTTLHPLAQQLRILEKFKLRTLAQIKKSKLFAYSLTRSSFSIIWIHV